MSETIYGRAHFFPCNDASCPQWFCRNKRSEINPIKASNRTTMEIFAHEMARKDAQIGLLKKVVESSEKLVDALFEKGRYLAIDASVCTLHVDYIQAKAAAGICPKL